MTDITTIHHEDGKTQRIDATLELPRITQWYWVIDPNGESSRWLGCVVQMGSNFVELEGPCREGRGSHRARVHIDHVDERLVAEPNYRAVIDDRVQKLQSEISGMISEIQELSLRLGVTPNAQIQNAQATSGTALAVMSNQVDVGAYQQALVKAKEETIPAIQEKIRRRSETLANWLKAEIIQFTALADDAKQVINAMTDRVFNIELYAGLVESADQFADGEPASQEEKLRVFQRMLYCDEEALLAYDSGGMDITNLREFKDWLARPDNRDRILPYPRCMVAMRVRRNTKDRDSGGSLWQMFANMKLAQGDKMTFLFVRNGERLYCIHTALEFDDLIFPSHQAFNAEPMVVRMCGARVEDMMPLREYEALVAEKLERKAKSDHWKLENPREIWEAAHPGHNSFSYDNADPFRDTFAFREHEWRRFDDSNVYFDEALEKVNNDFKKYNRVAVIIQGLFDRSDCLAPHQPVRSWTPEGFRDAIELIYDGTGLLFGEPPCFETYRQRCNAQIDENSVLLGQDDAWQEKEAETECKRINNSWRSTRDTYRPKRFKPYGDEGPGYLARPSQVKKRAKKAVFTWLRKRRSGEDRYDGTIRATITVPFDRLFNISAYRPGDFKNFFQDPRTRQKYLKWAPLLIAAEDFYSKGEVVQQPVD